MIRAFLRAALCAALVALIPSVSFAAESARPSAAAIKEDLRGFGIYATVLHVAAHPDDENRLLLAYLSRVRNYRTGYLSVTRGDGGQNEIGGEFGEKLGLARTHELLAGRRFDGARQFFTRALVRDAIVWTASPVTGSLPPAAIERLVPPFCRIRFGCHGCDCGCDAGCGAAGLRYQPGRHYRRHLDGC